MTSTTTLEDLAVVGRRVEFAYYRSLHDDSETVYLPGVITAITDDVASLRVRLDGQRSNLAVRPDYEGLRYLAEVGPVPELPMGCFTPTADDFGGHWAGVPVCSLQSEEIVILTDDRSRASAALRAFCEDMWIDLEFLPEVESRWAVFEWQPEDAECPWTVRFDVQEGDDQAIRIHYLPA